MQNTQIKRDFAGTSVIQVNIKTTVHLSIPLSLITPCEPMGGYWSGPIRNPGCFGMSLYWPHPPPNSEKVINEVQSEETDVRSRHSGSWISFEVTFFSAVHSGNFLTFHSIGFGFSGRNVTSSAVVWLHLVREWDSSLDEVFLPQTVSECDFLPCQIDHFLRAYYVLQTSLYCYSIQLSAWNVVAGYQEKGSVYFVVGGGQEWSFGAKHSCVQSSCSAS